MSLDGMARQVIFKGSIFLFTFQATVGIVLIMVALVLRNSPSFMIGTILDGDLQSTVKHSFLVG